MTAAAEEKPITVNLIIGSRREEVELPEGATNGDVVDKVGDHVSIRSDQEDISRNPEAPVRPGQVFTAQPSQPKQGS